MKQVTAYRCEHCGKLYIREHSCREHENNLCNQNPDIRPLCYSCKHYEASWRDEEKEQIEYGCGVNIWGTEYYDTKLFSPNKCTHPKCTRKLFNHIKLSDEMWAALADAEYDPMPNRRSGGCGYYDAIPEHPYATKL